MQIKHYHIGTPEGLSGWGKRSASAALSRYYASVEVWLSMVLMLRLAWRANTREFFTDEVGGVCWLDIDIRILTVHLRVSIPIWWLPKKTRLEDLCR